MVIGSQGLDEISIPVGKNTIKYSVEWSNGFAQENEITIQAVAGREYRLSAYELNDTESENIKTYDPADPILSEIGTVLLLPVIVVTTPIWYFMLKSEEYDEHRLPFVDCCFVWV